MSKNRGKRSKQDSYEAKPTQEESSNKFILEAKSANQKNYLHTIRKNVITICTGPAGSGKTLLATGYGLQNILCQTPVYDKLVIIRSVREACGEEMGFLPGNVDEKMLVWLYPVIDNLKELISDGAIECLLRKKKIEGIPTSFLRGRSLNNCFILVDEGQNLTSDQMLMILTRVGEGSKLVINGDLKQSDLKDFEKSGLADAMNRLEGMEGVGICRLDHTDIVRNALIGEILYRYEKLDLPPEENKE